jgi:sphinganine-1-phosphate aldolase
VSDHPDAPDRPVEPTIVQYRDDYETYRSLPRHGRPRERILAELQEMHDLETGRWEDGFVSGAVYNGDPDHIDFVNRAYAIHSQSNPLHTDLWPSAVKFESEIVAMTASMLGGDGLGGGPGSADGVCGVVTSGGSESIQLAMKTYRDRGRTTRGIERPNMVLPTTAHAAFAKAAHNFGIEARWIAPTDGWVADVDAMADAVDDDTVVVVGSAPPFPHGLIDPIPELSAMALERGVGFHTDSCLGGFVVPWAERLGHPVPVCDFRLPGVTSISADTHKFGYAAKGTSVVLYRDQALRHFQYFTITDWPGGLYCSPGFAGSRPGGLSAACWAAMVSTGEEGYLDATRRILDAGAACPTSRSSATRSS